ncbi:MAG: hypothetical protein ACK2T3_03255 [Candidatus Promineifilaceae bacterium]
MDHVYKMEEYAEAFTYMIDQHPQGKVVITM